MKGRGAWWPALCAAVVLGCASSPQRAVECAPPAGVEALWRDPDIRYVVLGEYHGTDAMPAAAAEIACDAAKSGARTLVALEMPQRHQDVLAAFVEGTISADDMLAASEWGRRRDGTGSIAMLALLQRLRDLRSAGLDVSVAAVQGASSSDADLAALVARFDPPTEVDARRSSYDLQMAANLLDHAARVRAARVILLVGEAHGIVHPSPSSSFNPQTGAVTHFIRMHTAAALPRDQTISLRFTHAGGSARAMLQNGESVVPLASTELELRAPAVIRAPYPADAPAYDGRIFVGPISRSPPAAR